MSNLHKKMESWVKAGLLSDVQATSILSFEASNTDKKSWVLYGIVSRGVAAIGIGIVSISAANWQSIPAALKLAVYLAVQTGLGFTLTRFLGQQGAVKEGLIGAFALMFFAGIGLTAQVFNIRSDGWSGVLFWCLLSLPILLHSRIRPMFYLWVVMLFVTESIWFVSLAKSSNELQTTVNIAFGILLGIYLKFALGVFRFDRFRIPPYLDEALRAISFLIIFLGGTIIGNIFWYVGSRKLLSGVGSDTSMILRLQYAPWFGALLVALALLLRKPMVDRRLMIVTISIFMGLAAITTIPVIFEIGASKLIGTILTVIIWWIAAIGAVHMGRKKVFDAITLAITLRLLVVYFEVFGSMMATGAGLILSGIITLGFAWVWYKFRHKAAEWVGGT